MIRIITLIFALLSCISQRAQTSVITKPMLDDTISVPNGGIFRTWSGSLKNIKIINVFEESPYNNNSNLLYCRYDWCQLEPEKGLYEFSKIESLMKRALANHQRILIGLANMTIAKSSAHYEYDNKQISTPKYIYDALKKSRYPFLKDETYLAGGYSPDYNSPFLYQRYKSLLVAFAKWLDGNVEGTSIKRRYTVYGIETRYAGYWGEGSINGKIYPIDYKVLDRYMKLYIKYFPDIQLIGGAHETNHLPNYAGDDLSKYNAKQLAAMRHVYHLLNLKNKYGRIGLFIDSWHPNSNQYDSVSKRVLLDDENHIIHLYDYFKIHVYGQVYLTGEFDYFVNKSNQGNLPYVLLGEQFTNRHTSGITLSNMNVHNAGQYVKRIQYIYDNTKKVMAFTGYRIVLDKTYVSEDKVAFTLTNIGISKIFHNYYQLHLIIKDSKGKTVSDIPSDFDLRTLDYCKKSPLEYDSNNGKLITFKLPKEKGRVYLIIKDKYGIEYPMTLSNYGRQNDGSYYLGEIK